MTHKIKKPKKEPPAPLVKLTEKQTTVLRLICCEEKNVEEIGEIVHLSPRTVESIRDILKVKSRTKTLAGLGYWAGKNNVV